MDPITFQLAEYATSLTQDKLPYEVVHDAKRLIIDALACAIGGFDTDIGRITRTIAERVTTSHFPAHILGTRVVSTPDSAAFANATMIRALDFNDMIPAGHPSDALGAVIAVADAVRATGPKLISALVVTYEVFSALGSVADYQEIGWDQGWAISLATTCGIVNLLGLSQEEAAHAVSIAASAHISLRQVRAGQLSMWKGAAAPYAAAEAVRATLIAAEGMTGPARAFDGRHGVFERLLEPFSFPALGRSAGEFHLAETRLKFWPVEYNAQSVVWLALKLREWARPEHIEAISVETYWAGWSEIGSDPEKWRPKSRETADHSLPYIMAVAMRDGRITASSFESGSYRDSTLHAFMANITVQENPEFTAAWPDKMIVQVTATNRSGDQIVLREDNPRGHHSNPMTDDDIEKKFIGLAKGRFAEDRVARLLPKLWALENEVDTASLLEDFVICELGSNQN